MDPKIIRNGLLLKYKSPATREPMDLIVKYIDTGNRDGKPRYVLNYLDDPDDTAGTVVQPKHLHKFNTLNIEVKEW